MRDSANGLPVGAKSCHHSLIATDTTRAPFNLRDEHLASRKEWGAYINLTTVVHRQTAAQADEFIARIRARLEKARPTGTVGKWAGEGSNLRPWD